jgi:uncharacterized protein YfkK (UPF0435 family)
MTLTNHKNKLNMIIEIKETIFIVNRFGFKIDEQNGVKPKKQDLTAIHMEIIQLQQVCNFLQHQH